MKSIIEVVGPGRSLVAHLSNVAAEDAEYAVYYAVGSEKGVADINFAEVYRDTHGAPAAVPLVLNTKTTPLLLNLPGVYKFVKQSVSGGLISTVVIANDSLPRGALV